MNFAGQYRIEAPRALVWEALNDPEVLRQAIPGCQEIEKESDTAFTAKVKAKLGPVSAAFKGRVELTDLDPPNAYTISGEGQGGVAGFAKGGARVSLEDTADGATTLSYTAEGQVGGKLAQIGARLVEGSAKKIADDFFGAFNALVSERAASRPQAAPAAAAAEPVAAAHTPAPAAPVAPHTVSARADSGADLIARVWFGLIGLVLLAMIVGAALWH
jgi:carbon monoxide dehydrogenase subunit G